MGYQKPTPLVSATCDCAPGCTRADYCNSGAPVGPGRNCVVNQGFASVAFSTTMAPVCPTVPATRTMFQLCCV